MAITSGYSLQSTASRAAAAAAAAAPAVMVGPVLTLQPSKLDRMYWSRRNQDLIKIDRCVTSLELALTRYDNPNQPSSLLLCTRATGCMSMLTEYNVCSATLLCVYNKPSEERGFNLLLLNFAMAYFVGVLVLMIKYSSKYLRWRTILITWYRLLMVVLGTTTLGALRQSQGASFLFSSPRLTFAVKCLVYSHAFSKPLDVFGSQVSFPLQTFILFLGTILDLFCAATVTFVNHMAEPAYFNAVQQVYTLAHTTIQLLTWPFSMPSSPPAPLENCKPCTALILITACHLIVDAAVLYAYYMTEWKLRRRFLQGLRRHEMPSEAVAKACDSRLARLLVDGYYGSTEAVIVHCLVLALLVWASWAAAHVLVLHVLPWVLPAHLMQDLCPLAPTPCQGLGICPW